MDNTQFFYKNFFEDTGIFESLFEYSNYPWETLNKIEEFIKNFKSLPASSEYEEREENFFIGKNVTIDSTAKIEGMAIIGHNTTIGHAAFIRGDVLLGDNVHVGHATEVKHSIIFKDTALAHLNYIGDSVVGGNINISGGATLANWRFDKKKCRDKKWRREN